MVSKRVARRSAAAEELASSTVSWSAPTREIVASLLEPYLRDGETMPDIGLFQELLGRLVADHGQKLDRNDQSLDQQATDALFLRHRRNEEAERLRDLLRSVRFYLDRLRGRGTGAQHGLGHGLSRKRPFELVRLGQMIAALLPIHYQDPGAHAAGLPDPQDLARSIAEQTATLRDILDQLQPQVIGVHFVRGQQKRGIKDTEKAVRRSAGLLAELYKFCDHPYLAKKVRPQFRKKPKAKGEDEAPSVLDGLDLADIRPLRS